jgi:hypothetical protein
MSGWIEQCLVGLDNVWLGMSIPVYPWFNFFLLLALHRFSKLSYAILCRCLPSDWLAGGTLAMTPPPTIVQAEEMIGL